MAARTQPGRDARRPPTPVVVPQPAPSARASRSSARPRSSSSAARAELRALELRLKPEHPDIGRAKRMIAELESEGRGRGAAAAAVRADVAGADRGRRPSRAGARRGRCAPRSRSCASASNRESARRPGCRTIAQGHAARVQAAPALEVGADRADARLHHAAGGYTALLQEERGIEDRRQPRAPADRRAVQDHRRRAAARAADQPGPRAHQPDGHPRRAWPSASALVGAARVPRHQLQDRRRRRHDAGAAGAGRHPADDQRRRAPARSGGGSCCWRRRRRSACMLLAAAVMVGVAAAAGRGLVALMYESFYGFRERPFDLTPNPRFLVLTDVAPRGAEQPRVRHRQPQGHHAARRRGRHRQDDADPHGARAAAGARALRAPAEPGADPRRVRRDAGAAVRAERAARARRRRRCCSSSRSCCASATTRGETTVLIVDEAQSLPLELLEEIRLLANIETNERKLLSVILAGQPEVTAAAERPIAAPAEAARRAALRAAAADAAGDRRLHRRPHPRRRRRRRAGVHPRGGDADPRAIARHSAHDQRDRRQRAADRLRRGQRPVNSAIVREVCRDFDLGRRERRRRAGRRRSRGAGAAPRPPPAASARRLGEPLQSRAARRAASAGRPGRHDRASDRARSTRASRTAALVLVL